MPAFFRNIETLWKKPFDPQLARYRFGLLCVGMLIDIIMLLAPILGEAVYITFYIPALLILAVCYITGNILGWHMHEARARIGEHSRKNAFIERLLSTSPVGALMTDRDGLVTYTNSEAHKIFSPEGDAPVIGRALPDLDLVANTALHETIAKLQNSFAGVFQNEIAFKKAPASPIEWFHCTFSPVVLDGERIGIIGWIHDRTSQKRKQEDVINSIILALTKAIDAKDKGTHEHSLRVRKIAMTLARFAHLPPEKYPNLEYSALLHDVGKVLLADDIIRGKTTLTADQKEIIFRLPEYSASFLDGIEDLAEVKDIVYYQKEWFVPPKDEKSSFRPFPGIKTGDGIPIEARIIAVADAFEGMTTEKGYRKAMPKEIAVIEFKRSSGIKPTEDEINRLLSFYKQTRNTNMMLDELLSHSRIERQFDYKIVRALESAILANEI
ncbi:MAG: HD domain-containing phosphohydrolase [Planctomycetota bacterium]